MKLFSCPDCYDSPCHCSPTIVNARLAREQRESDYQTKISNLEDEVRILKGILDHYDIDHELIRRQYQANFLMTEYGKIDDNGKVK